VHRDQSARPAQFSRHDRSATLFQAARQLTKNSEKLLPASHQIAERLHGIVREDKRISGAALAICLYSARTGREAENFLGILKLDPSRVYHPVVRSDPSGTSYVTLESVGNVLLATGERAQKGASIRLGKAGADEGELMIVDHQRPRSDEPAQFFTGQFLGAELFLDRRELTRRFYESVIKASNSIRSNLSGEQAEKLRKSLDAALQSNQVQIDPWIDRQRLPAAAKNALRGEIRKQIGSQEISVDAATAGELRRLRTYRGDRGFQLTVEADRYDSVFVEVPKIVDDPERGPVIELVLQVKQLREVM
jgi:hypothetical protein